MAFKKIFNLHEEATHIRLRETCQKYGASVYPKLRLADVLPIESSGITDDLYRYALQAHFDFVITDDAHTPLFSVEFDGPLHREEMHIARDEKKNNLCKIFDFPILRINARYLNKKYRNFDLLSWFVEVWFFREEFFKAQEQGLIPWDEPCDPMLIMRLPGRKERFPLWLSADQLIKIQKLAKEKKIKDFAPTMWIGADDYGNYHGIMWLWIDEKSGVVTHSAMRAQNYPVVEGEILSELLIFQLYDELSRVLKGEAYPVAIDTINMRVKDYTEKYQMMMAGGLHLPPGNPFKAK